MERPQMSGNDAIAQGNSLTLADTPRPEYKLSNDELHELTPKQDLFIDYMAFAAFTLDGACRLDQMTSEQIASKLGVTDRTLRRWRRSIPNYAELVKQRRMEKFRIEIEDGVWKGLIAKALMGEAKQAEMVLSHFSDYTPPAQKVDHRVDGLSDLVQLARAAKRKSDNDAMPSQNAPEPTETFSEGEVVEVTAPLPPAPQTAPERATTQIAENAPTPIAANPPQTSRTIRVIQPPDEPEFDDLP